MHSTSTTEHAATMRNVAMPRPGNGASSRRRNSSSGMRSTKVLVGNGNDVAAERAIVSVSVERFRVRVARRRLGVFSGPAPDNGNRRSTDAEDVRRLRVFDTNPHREALRDMDPVELPFDLGQA